ncbi:hypothetical protein [Alicycliphilus denitrificans]|uniref:hypothetical protein n=1 Tax=Alicycliphilus denitrificans TaxID=179636 RepID=UPI003850A0CE
MPTKHPDFRRRMMALADGGHVRGPGTATSDSIHARLSDGEFVLPADTVRKVGVKSLRDLVRMTHKPSGQPAHTARFADGGLVEDDQLKRPNSFGDAAAAAQDSTVSQINPAPAHTPATAAGLQGVADRVSQIPTEGPKAPAADGSQNSWANTEAGRNLTNAAAALPGVAGAVPAVAKTGGAISSGLNVVSRLMNVGAATAGASAVPMLASAAPAPAGQRPLPEGVTPSTAGAGRGSINPLAVDPSRPLQSPAAPPTTDTLSGYGPIGDRTTLTNEQAATMNPAGRITVTRGANGTMEFSGGNVSGQVSYNDPSGKALPGGGLNGRGFSAFDVAPAGTNVATGPNGSYAFAERGIQQQASGGPAPGSVADSSAGLRGVADRLPQGTSAGGGSGSSGYTADGIDVRGLNPSQAAQYASEVRGAQAINRAQAEQRKSWESRVAQWDDPFSGVGKARRNMEVSLGSMTPYHLRGKGGPGEALQAGRLAAYNTLQKEHFGMVAGDRDDATRRYQSDNTLQAENLQQAGANTRAAFSAMSDAERNQIARGRLAMEQTAAGFQNRTAQRIENAQVAFENASTPEQQRSARERLLALSGKSEGELWAHSPGGQVVDPKTQQLITQPGVIYNRRTGETRADAGGQDAAQAMPSSRDAMVKGQVYQTARGPARWDGGQFQLVR